MGFIQSPALQGATYFTISDGKCRIRLKEATEGCITRVTKDGNTVHEYVHDQFVGKLQSASVVDTDFGKQWKLVFADASGNYVLSLKYTSGYAKTLMMALCNSKFDPRMPITIKPYSFAPKDNPNKTIIGTFAHRRVRDGRGVISGTVGTIRVGDGSTSGWRTGVRYL